jgi:hypothetical protein
VDLFGNIKIKRMGSNEFVYWLQGALELNPDMLKNGMTPGQVQTIQDHLDLVFTKVTPDRFKKEEPEFPIEFPDLNLYNGTGSPPPHHPSTTSDVLCSKSDALFCSQFNQKSNLTEGLVVHVDGENKSRRRRGASVKC